MIIFTLLSFIICWYCWFLYWLLAQIGAIILADALYSEIFSCSCIYWLYQLNALAIIDLHTITPDLVWTTGSKLVLTEGSQSMKFYRFFSSTYYKTLPQWQSEDRVPYTWEFKQRENLLNNPRITNSEWFAVWLTIESKRQHAMMIWASRTQPLQRFIF